MLSLVIVSYNHHDTQVSWFIMSDRVNTYPVLVFSIYMPVTCYISIMVIFRVSPTCLLSTCLNRFMPEKNILQSILTSFSWKCCVTCPCPHCACYYAFFSLNLMHLFKIFFVGYREFVQSHPFSSEQTTVFGCWTCGKIILLRDRILANVLHIIAISPLFLSTFYFYLPLRGQRNNIFYLGRFYLCFHTVSVKHFLATVSNTI